MKLRAPVVAVLALVLPGAVGAQTVNGNADFAYGRSTTTTNDTTVLNKTLLQTYTLGYQSILWDPRLMHYNAELIFQKSGMTFGEQSGHSDSLGYNLGASLFPARPFPLSIRATRTNGAQSGNMPTSVPIRGALVLPSGANPDFDTRSSSFGVNWQLTTPHVPKVEFSLSRASTGVALGSLEAEQNDRVITGSITQETAKTRHLLRFQQTNFENLTDQAFSQHVTDLAYEMSARMTDRTRGIVRAGYRRQYSLFDLPPQYTNIGRGDSLLPGNGGYNVYYSAGSLEYRPSERLITDLTVSADRAQSASAASDAALVSSTGRYEILKGLSLNGRAETGIRGQQTAAERIDVRTYNVVGGAAYQFARRFVQASASYDRGRGANVERDKGAGDVSLWNGRTSATVHFLRALDVTGAYERSRSKDDVLSFSNFDVRRTVLSAVSQATQRVSVQATVDRTNVDRGRGADFAHVEYLTGSGGLTMQISRHARGSFAIGQFQNRMVTGTDRSFFATGVFDATFGRLSTNVTTRRQRDALELTRLTQDGTYTTASADYRVGLFSFGLDYRFTTLDLTIPKATRPTWVRSKQLLFRVTRRFAMDVGQ